MVHANMSALTTTVPMSVNRHTPVVKAFAMQNSSIDSSSAPELMFKLIVQGSSSPEECFFTDNYMTIEQMK